MSWKNLNSKIIGLLWNFWPDPKDNLVLTVREGVKGFLLIHWDLEVLGFGSIIKLIRVS